MSRRVALEPVGHRQLGDGSDAHGSEARDLLDGGQRERRLRKVGVADAPVTRDAQSLVRVEDQQRHVGEEELAHLDRGALDRRLQVLLVAEHRDHLCQPGRPHERLCHVLLGALEPLAQRRDLILTQRSAHGLCPHLVVLSHVQRARTATLELCTPLEPVVRANSPKV